MRPFRLPIRLGLLALAIVAAPSPMQAQSSARASVDAEVRFTSVAGAGQELWGGRLWFGLGNDFRFGGGAWALPRASRSGTLSESGLELDFGYGGVAVEWNGLPISGVSLRTLFGAGSGTTLDQVTGSRVDSEGFLVLEPEIAGHIDVTRWLGIGATVGWRFVFQAEGLTRVNPDDLRSAFFGVAVRFGPF